MIKVGYLGPKGTFSHEALIKYMKDIPHVAVDFSSIPEIFRAVRQQKVDEAIVPIENSIEGAVNVTMDMLSHESDLKIKAEVVIPIREHLLVKEGTDLSKIKYVISHPQPLGQCREFLLNQLPHAITKIADSTAAAAEEVARGAGDTAAIGSVAAAETYGLKIAVKDIQDRSNNYTRFVVVGMTDAKRTGKDKTSIIFSTENEPGSLYKVLGIFNLWDINLTRIESRPARDKLGRYIFFVDLIGHREDEDVKDALTMVKRKTSFFKILGSYPICPDVY